MKVGDTVWHVDVDFDSPNVTIKRVELTAIDRMDSSGILSYYTENNLSVEVNTLFPSREEAEAQGKKIVKKVYDTLMNKLKDPEPKQNWCNIKNNKIYTILHTAKDVTENKNTSVVVYSFDKEVFVRSMDEFKDKFVPYSFDSLWGDQIYIPKFSK